MVIALLELVSFYLTGYDNNGRFPVKLSLPKKVLTYAFTILVAIFLFLYFAMFWFILVWAILAAVLNPSKYLPYTAAAMTLFATIVAKYLAYKLKY